MKNETKDFRPGTTKNNVKIQVTKGGGSIQRLDPGTRHINQNTFTQKYNNSVLHQLFLFLTTHFCSSTFSKTELNTVTMTEHNESLYVTVQRVSGSMRIKTSREKWKTETCRT